MTTLRRMAPSELGRIGEIDRSERITQQYRCRAGALELIDVDIDAVRWGEPGEHSVEHYVEEWRPLLDGGGVLLGAFDGERLAGFVIYEPPSTRRDRARCAVLFVSRAYRGRGIGGRLVRKIVELARADRAPRLYVSATPTRRTVDFYRRQGFELAVEPDPEWFALEPEDIHLELEL